MYRCNNVLSKLEIDVLFPNKIWTDNKYCSLCHPHPKNKLKYIYSYWIIDSFGQNIN